MTQYQYPVCALCGETVVRLSTHYGLRHPGEPVLIVEHVIKARVPFRERVAAAPIRAAIWMLGRFTR